MRSCSCTSQAHGRVLGWLRPNTPPPPFPPPACCVFAQVLTSLDSAAERLVVRRDFQRSMDTCEKGLESLCSLAEHDESSSLLCFELKAALCSVGIQALAELNQWQRVLAWVLQHYGTPEKIPVKVLQMCILLYSKVGEPGTMQEASNDWLKCPANKSLPGYGAVAELYILHILVPCCPLVEAREFVLGQVGSAVLSGAQKQAALEMLESQERCAPSCTSSSIVAQSATSATGTRDGDSRLKALLHQLYRGLTIAGTRMQSLPFGRMLLAAFLLFLLLLRIDPALPSAFRWISSLLRILRQLWDAMTGPYHQTTRVPSVTG
ncbi:peroxisome assembly protein 26 isoform X1 [Scleropages formosus]|uniref:Peroxisomal biogenesis factor 26 n=1 Tax=Scleropages formosus TaxID=113540 RepID=A0A8C9QY32_SCLFO|nr:peroxisome assembly protein 26 isoform X1 [Scleropages formosus]